MNTIRLDNIKQKFPENWNECTLSQLLGIYSLLLPNTIIGPKSLAKTIVVLKLINARFYRFRFLRKFEKLPKHMIIQVFFPIVEKLLEKNTLTEFKLKHFRVWFKKYYAPADGLANITIEEFRFLDPMYVNYKKTGETHWLDGIVGILYRKKREDYNPTSVDYKGDIREDFNEHQIIRNSKIASKLSLEKRQLIFLTYEGCRNEIIDSCSNLFNSEESQEKGRNSGYGGLITELAGDKFGDYNQTCKTNLITAFNYLDEQAEKLKKQKK